MFGVFVKMFGAGGCLFPLPHPSPRWWFLRTCSENVRKCSELVGAPLPTPPPRWPFPRKCSNVRNMFRNRSELGDPLPHTSPGTVDPPKMFRKRSGIVRSCWGASLPHLPPGGGSPGNVRRMFGEYSALVGVSSPLPPPLPAPPGGGSPENVRRMFGKCLELVGVPSPHLPRGGAPPLKCSENVRKMSGTGGCPSPPLPRDGGSPENVRTMS